LADPPCAKTLTPFERTVTPFFAFKLGVEPIVGDIDYYFKNMDTINFTRGVPANESFPIDEVIDAATAALKAKGTAMLQYGPALGFQPLREWLAEWQKVSVDRVLTGNGSLQLIEFLCLQMLKPGDVVFTESPTYDRTIGLLRRHGAKVVGIPLETDGPNVDALEAALKQQVPKFFYVIPDFQNPAGATCSAVKRRRIVELAHRYGVLIVEDAPYRLLRYRGKEEPTLYELAPERTLHMSSFTKLIAPGVRTGFMIGEPSTIAQLAKVAEDTYISPGYVAQGITWEWCRRGLLLPQIERLKKLYGPRLDACLAGLDKYMPDARTTRPDGGFFISLTLPEGVLTANVRMQAAKLALNLTDGVGFFPDGGGERFLRLPFCALSEAEIDDGIRRLAESVRAAGSMTERASRF
jgi:2-aminoadipate transaminase